MEKFAGVTLFAEAPKPVLAYKIVVGRRDMVLIWTPIAVWTVALHESLACWSIRVQAKAIFAPKKVAEFEGISWQSRLLLRLIWRFRSYWCHDLSHDVAGTALAVFALLYTLRLSKK